MRSEEPAVTMDETGGPDAAAGRLGAPYSEAWGYFHLAPARPGHAAGPWATCRLCGEQVGRGPGWHASTPALWKHLRSAHRRELAESAARRSQIGRAHV